MAAPWKLVEGTNGELSQGNVRIYQCVNLPNNQSTDPLDVRGAQSVWMYAGNGPMRIHGYEPVAGVRRVIDNEIGVKRDMSSGDESGYILNPPPWIMIRNTNGSTLSVVLVVCYQVVKQRGI